MKQKYAELLFYAGVGFPAYYLIYLGLVGLGIVPNYYMNSGYGYYNNKPIPFYAFSPEKPYAIYFIIAGILISIGMYFHYYLRHGKSYKK